MFKSNYHTHCNFCDGKGEPEDYITSAIREGLSEIGFSSHSPLPFPSGYTIASEQFQNYVDAIKCLKEKYRQNIKILLGLEVDFLPQITDFQLSFLNSPDLDYKIGSVHYVGCHSSGKPWPVDGDDELFKRGIDEIFEGNIQKSVENYYTLVRQMAMEKQFDIIGHLDLIKKNNFEQKYFSEKELWYQETVSETLKVIAEYDWIVEVNTGGLRKPIASIYPSHWILRKCKDLKIKLMINSDAHSPEQVCSNFPEVHYLLQYIGYKEIYHLSEGKWEAVSLL
jgi:histidinol-phosphatase (PHP family)